MRIGIVTDSTAKLTEQARAELLERVNGLFAVVELTVTVNGEERPDSQWPAASVCTALQAGLSVSTSLPSPGDFTQAYRELINQGAEALVVVTMSAQLSGTYDSARTAGDLIESETDVRVHVVDSQTVSAGLEGAVAIAVAGSQLEPDQLAAEVTDWCAAETSTYFVPADLEYLRRGGRIGAASTLMGRALAIVPVLGLRDGIVEPLARVRTRARAEERLAAFVSASVMALAEAHPGRGVEVVLLHAEESPEAAGAHFQRLVRVVDGLPLSDDVPVRTEVLSTVITAHVGPGAVGVVVQTVP